MKVFGKSLGYFGSFLIGILFVFAITPIYKVLDEFLITGFEVQSQASFPLGHIARLYSRGGFGDQTFTLEVDGKTVWVSGDAAPGDLEEKLIWDKAGKVVTLELVGKRTFTYDAENRTELKY